MMQKKRGESVDRVYQELHDRIMSGLYAPGVRMSQADLAVALNTSRTPLREALNRLQANGLVVATTNRGMEVAPVRFEHTEQLYALRLLVEPPLVGALVPKLGQAEIQQMRQALLEMGESGESNKDFQEIHRAFHDVLLSMYPESIREIIESSYERINRHQRLHFSRPHVPDDFTHTDHHFLDAIVEGNAALARQWLEFHLIDAALGLMLDIDPTYVPEALFLAAAGLGIELKCAVSRNLRPISIRWTSKSAEPMASIETVNLIHHNADAIAH